MVIYQSLTGSFSLLYTSLVYVYWLSTLANAISGYLTAYKAPKLGQAAFRRASMFQMCCVYFTWRFSPHAIGLGYGVVRIIDIACALGMVLGILSFSALAITLPDKILAVAISVGTLALLTLAGYPIQLAMEGEEWWSCVREAYPMQEVAFSGYVYVPATWTLAIIMFGVTLFQRQIISPALFGYGFIISVLATLLVTVLMQEVHIPVVST
jgi:hypothetical protein